MLSRLAATCLLRSSPASQQRAASWLTRAVPQQGVDGTASRRWGPRGRLGVLLLLGTGSALAVRAVYGTEELKLALLIPTRLVRDVWCALSIVAGMQTQAHTRTHAHRGRYTGHTHAHI